MVREGESNVVHSVESRSRTARTANPFFAFFVVHEHLHGDARIIGQNKSRGNIVLNVEEARAWYGEDREV